MPSVTEFTYIRHVKTAAEGDKGMPFLRLELNVLGNHNGKSVHRSSANWKPKRTTYRRRAKRKRGLSKMEIRRSQAATLHT